MSFEVVCDVIGCEERAPAGVDLPMAMLAPAGWSILVRPPDELARTRAKKAMFEDAPPMLGPRGFMDGVGPQRFLICPKHELPKLKAPR